MKDNPSKAGDSQAQLALDTDAREVMGREFRDSSQETAVVLVCVLVAGHPHGVPAQATRTSGGLDGGGGKALGTGKCSLKRCCASKSIRMQFGTHRRRQEERRTSSCRDLFLMEDQEDLPSLEISAAFIPKSDAKIA